MPRVIIVYPSDPLGAKVGGVETFLKGFIAHAPEDFRFDFFGITSDRRVLPLRKPRTLFFGRKAFSFFPVISKQRENRKSPIPVSLRFTLGLYLRAVRPAPGVLLFNRLEPSLAFRATKYPKIGFIHSDIPGQLTSGVTEDLWFRWPRVYCAFEKSVFKSLDRVFTNSRKTLAHYARRYAPVKKKFAHVPVWADPEVFFPAEEPKRSIREALRKSRLFLPVDEPWIVFAGRLQKVKNPLLAVEGFMDYFRRRGTGILIVIGEGNLGTPLMKHIRRRRMTEKIFLLGRMNQQELADYYRAANLLVSTSHCEGGPRCILEALSSGIPVVTTDVGEVRRIVRGGVCGEIVAGRPSEIGRAIDAILSRPESYAAPGCLEQVSALTPLKILPPVYEEIRELSEKARLPR